MKKNTIFLDLCLFILLLGGCGTNRTEPSEPPSAADNTAGITEQDAMKAALEHAGLKENDLTSRHIEKDSENGKEIYEIEFYAGSSEYEYEIDAATGKILGWEEDAD